MSTRILQANKETKMLALADLVQSRHLGKQDHEIRGEGIAKRSGTSIVLSSRASILSRIRSLKT